MNGEYYLVFSVAVFLTLMTGSLKLIEGKGAGDYLAIFIVFCIIGLGLVWIYHKLSGSPGMKQA